MGVEESAATTIPPNIDVAIPAQYSLMSEQHFFQNVIELDEDSQFNRKPLLEPPFAGTWTMHMPSTICPRARVGHFTVVDDKNEIAYAGYGTSSQGALLPDLWALDLRSLAWKEIKLVNPVPKNGCRGVFFEGKIIVFGGYVNNSYSSDLQVINVQTGVVSIVETRGDIPEGRSTPLVGMHREKFYVWGGYNGGWPNDIHVLDLETLVWTRIQQNEKGRTGVPFVNYRGRIIAYGGSHSSGVFELNMNFSPPTTSIIQTTGSPPPSDVMNAGMVKVNQMLFYFGGKVKNSKWTILYAYDIVKKWWFIFHVRPDGETVTVSDGNVSENGIFMLPRIHSFGVAYSSSNRTIVAFLGAPAVDPPNIFLIKIGDALGNINMRNDMMEMLKL